MARAGYESPTPNRLRDIFWNHVNSGGDVHDPSMKQKELLKLVKMALGRVPELGKSNAKAATLRHTANRFYLERKFGDALLCYNESICYAEPGSDQVGMGYANRSAIYYEQGDYEFALYNIDLAKRNNYPEKLMPKLLARELSCKQQIEAGHSKGTVPCPRMDVNVEVHPKIPFMAKGLKMDYDPKFGRGVYAERDFNPGDIILKEKLELCGVSFVLSYRLCNQCCSEYQQSLIPCPNCPFVMYCSQECLDLNWKLYHRFECAVSTKLCSVARGMVFARLFFYGLSQFGDDVQAMMEYCDPEVTNLSDPLQLDYTNLNRLEVFKVLHNTKPRMNVDIDDFVKITAACYYAAFLMDPTVSAIIRTAAHRQFFLRSLAKYTRVTYVLMISSTIFYGHPMMMLRPIGSLFNHSCDPNAIASFDSGTTKIILLRPVRRGEQIFTANGRTWWPLEVSQELHFKCQCVVCDEGPRGRKWRRMLEQEFPSKTLPDIRTLREVITRDDVSIANKLNGIQQFIKRYTYLHPHAMFGPILMSNFFNLCLADQYGNSALNRAALQAKFVEH